MFLHIFLKIMSKKFLDNLSFFFFFRNEITENPCKNILKIALPHLSEVINELILKSMNKFCANMTLFAISEHIKLDYFILDNSASYHILYIFSKSAISKSN